MYYEITLIQGNREIVSKVKVHLHQRPSARVGIGDYLIWEPLTFTIMGVGEDNIRALSGMMAGGEMVKFPKMTAILTFFENDNPYEEWMLKNCFVRSYDWSMTQDGFRAMTLCLAFHSAAYSHLYLEQIV